jgi:tol-pal system protein YbgF
VQRLQSDYDVRLTQLEQTQQPATTQAITTPTAPQATPPAPSTAINMPANTNAATQMAPTDMPPMGAVNGSLGAIKSQDGKVTGIVTHPTAPPLPTAPGDYGLTVQEQYDRAFDFLRKANYEEAENAFKTFIDKNPKNKLIDNAKYWYGETLYVRGRYDEAAVAFADAFQQNPHGTKAPDSLLKLGMSLGAINKVPDACATLAELKGKYPNASPNVRSIADEERTKFKCGAT